MSAMISSYVEAAMAMGEKTVTVAINGFAATIHVPEILPETAPQTRQQLLAALNAGRRSTINPQPSTHS